MIRIDLDNVNERRIGRPFGLDPEREFRAYGDRLAAVAEDLWARRGDDEAMLGWLELPRDEAGADRARTLAQELDPRITDVVVLGIGGSSLGAVTVARALGRPEGRRLHVVDNVDPDTVGPLLAELDPRRTLVNVISKSGTTAETMAAFLVFVRWLEEALGDAATGHVVVTTDPEAGVLRPLARSRGYRTFTVPPSVGGRFSVLSAVGLVPLALAGVDVHGLLRGAAWADEAARQPLASSPVLQAALVQYLAMRRGASVTVLMPYSSRLSALGAWFVQLWAESLGKAVDRSGSVVHAGSTPIGALGATDQHSQVQLFNEGPFDKLVAFVRLESFEHDLVIPAPGEGLEALDYLGERTFGELLDAEARATAHALADHGRPNYTLVLHRLDAERLGALLQLLMWQTAVVGSLLGIDAFDQPGVELGKRYTYALMGRPGFEELRERLRAAGVVEGGDPP